MPFPKTLHHPAFRPALISVNVGDELPEVRPAAFPPVVVYNSEDEEFHLSRGYAPGAEVSQLPIILPPKFQERQNIRAPIRGGVAEAVVSAEPLSRDYPKYVGDKIARSAEEESEFLELLRQREVAAAVEHERQAEVERVEAERASSSASEIADLRSEVADLKSMFAEFMKKWDEPGAKRARP